MIGGDVPLNVNFALSKPLLGVARVLSPNLTNTLFHHHHHHHYHHVCVASEGRCVTPVPWPRRMADLHNVEGMLPVSLRT